MIKPDIEDPNTNHIIIYTNVSALKISSFAIDNPNLVEVPDKWDAGIWYSDEYVIPLIKPAFIFNIYP